MYKVELNKSVRKFLKSHPDIWKKFFYALKKITVNPFNNLLDIKKLIWSKNHYRLRIWKYRFLYEVRENEIIVYFYKADSRWNIYK
jgi:mRNA interferase RelE/StbE